MTRALSKEEKAYMLAYRKATGKSVQGKYSLKQVPEYNEWAEENHKPVIDLNVSVNSNDEDVEEDNEEEHDAGKMFAVVIVASV